MWGDGSTDCHRIETTTSRSSNYTIITSYSSSEGITCSALAAGVYDQNHPGSSERSLLVPSSLCS
jgi:hypothetical protein